MSAALPLSVPGERKSAAFGTTSLVFAGLTVLLPVVLMVFFINRAAALPDGKEQPLAGLGIILAGGLLSLAVCGLTSLAGSITGAVGLARREQSTWRSVVGLLVNVPVVMFMIYLIVAMQTNN